MSETERRRDSEGRFLRKRAVDMDKVTPVDEGNRVGRVSKRHVDDSVRFHPVNVDVLKAVIDRAADGHSAVMLAVPTQDTKNGATGCLVLAASEDKWWQTAPSPTTPVYVGAGSIYHYAGDSYSESDGS